MGISFGGTLGVQSRSESVAEGAQAALERPNLIEQGAQGSQESILNHFRSILERFLGVQSAPRIGRAESRSTFAKIDIFPLGDRLFLHFAFPEVSQKRSGVPSRRSLDTLGGSWGVPGGRQGRPGAFLGSLLGDFGRLLGDLRGPEGPQDAPRTEFGRIWG